MNEKAPKKPQSYSDLFPGRFLKADQFHGKKVTLTILDADLEELEGEDGKKQKCILTFMETPFKLVTCKTNGIAIREMFGTTLSNWIGKRVVLYPEKWRGDEEAIRVWGSPDIADDIRFTFRLARKGKQTRTLHKTGAGKAQPAIEPPADDAREPGSDDA
jgi:hypothetical protein